MAVPWVEMRVHGVSGTPPESILDFDRVQQVAGDEFGRVFQRIDEKGVRLDDSRDGHVVEAYHWGKFTSGSWSQAIWLLLAPFGIINAAQFTLEPPTSTWSKLCHTMAGAALRFIGVALTGLFVTGTAVITLDLWAWQRIGPNEDTLFHLALALGLLGPVIVLWMCHRLGRSRLVGDRPEPNLLRRILLLPRKGDKVVDGGQVEDFWERDVPSDLIRPGFFGNDGQAPTLRQLHLAAGLFIVAALGFSPNRADGEPSWALVLSEVLLAVTIFVVIAIGDPEKSASVRWEQDQLQGVKDGLHAVARPIADLLFQLSRVAAVGAVLYAALSSSPITDVTPHYPGIDDAASATGAAVVLGLLLLGLANLLLAISERHSVARGVEHKQFAPFAKGFACTLLTSAGVFVGVGYVGAFGLTAAKAFETDDKEIHPPELLSRVVYSWGITAILIVVIGAWGGVRWLATRERFRERARNDFTRDEKGQVPPRWIASIASAMWAARQKTNLVCVLSAFALTGIVLSIATAFELRTQWDDSELRPLPVWLSWLSQSETCETLPVACTDKKLVATGALLWLGTLTLTALAAGLITVGRSAILGEDKRRGVNVLWDVIAFWPRSAHPFVPPAYSHRAVRDLEERVDWNLRQVADDRVASGGVRDGRDVVLCPHSQGSLLAFAALLRMANRTDSVTAARARATAEAEIRADAARTGESKAEVDKRIEAIEIDLQPDPRNLEDIGLLTFGSQLQVLFPRGFPAYVNYPSITWLWDHIGGAWRNLYRDTDPLAGPVLSWNHYDKKKPLTSLRTNATPWVDPPPEPRRPGDPLPPPISHQVIGPEWRLLDPPMPDEPLEQHPLDKLRQHSDYWTDRAWRAALWAVRHAPPPPPPPPAAPVVQPTGQTT